MYLSNWNSRGRQINLPVATLGSAIDEIELQ